MYIQPNFSDAIYGYAQKDMIVQAKDQAFREGLYGNPEFIKRDAPTIAEIKEKIRGYLFTNGQNFCIKTIAEEDPETPPEGYTFVEELTLWPWPA